MGLGRMKHVELRFLFVKDLLKRERLTLSKIPGTENPADLGTKGASGEHSSIHVLDHWFWACESGCGGDQGSQEKLAILWKCWAAERVESAENT